jgi:hypothetical protein
MAEGYATTLGRAAKSRLAASPALLLILDLIVAGTDIALLQAWLGGSLDSLGLLVLHCALSALLICLTSIVRRSVDAVLVCRFFVLLLCGPLGSAVLLIQHLATLILPKIPLSHVRKIRVEPITSSDCVENIAAAIRQNRRRLSSHVALTSLHSIFLNGTLDEQNAAIQAISRNYSREMLPALMVAMNGRYPAVRVQAGAVYSKLRDSFRACAQELTAVLPARASFTSAVACEAHIQRCHKIARCGFLDEAAAAKMELLAEALADDIHVGRFGAPHFAPEIETILLETADRSQRHPTALSAGRFLTPSPRFKRYACGGVA